MKSLFLLAFIMLTACGQENSTPKSNDEIKLKYGPVALEYGKQFLGHDMSELNKMGLEVHKQDWWASIIVSGRYYWIDEHMREFCYANEKLNCFVPDGHIELKFTINKLNGKVVEVELK